jgi:hypothetical protein
MHIDYNSLSPQCDFGVPLIKVEYVFMPSVTYFDQKNKLWCLLPSLELKRPWMLPVTLFISSINMRTCRVNCRSKKEDNKRYMDQSNFQPTLEMKEPRQDQQNHPAELILGKLTCRLMKNNKWLL